MGMFDSFYHPCPDCGTEVEWQSKAGDCCLHEYRLRDNPPPPVIAGDLDGRGSTCEKCGATLKFLAVVLSDVVRG